MRRTMYMRAANSVIVMDNANYDNDNTSTRSSDTNFDDSGTEKTQVSPRNLDSSNESVFS